MRIAFFDGLADQLTPQRKGALLEQLVKRILEHCGYIDVRLRVKHSSLEYDVEGINPINEIVLVGEAKAHESSITGQDIAAFVGKLAPIVKKQARKAGESPRLDGMFISISSFTREAQDYLDSYDGSEVVPGVRLKTFVGNEIPSFLVERHGIITDEVLKTILMRDHKIELLDSWLVVGDRTEFLLATCGPNLVTRPTHYGCFGKDGSVLQLDSDTRRKLSIQIPSVSDLIYLSRPLQRSADQESKVLPSIATGNGWFDYKFPASPDYFIGRKEAIATILSIINSFKTGDTASRTLQILSRSGVGKSSLLVKLAKSSADFVDLVIDGRSLRVGGDIRLIVAALAAKINDIEANSVKIPRSMDDLYDAIDSISNFLISHNKAALIEVDQFESCLAIPGVFSSIIDIVASITVKQYPIVWLFARKNDFAVTFDQSAQIDLGRLNEISQIHVLEDFSPPESKELLDKLSQEIGQSIKPELSQAISTFSGGFPWLHKRLCAHVISLDRRGVSQREMVQTGLRAEDLFEEDLAGLDQQDLALLRTIAAHIPNTAAELSRRLEPEISSIRLMQKLNDFLGTKLLRVSGDIYDTYNDVFKSYLITDRIPFQNRYVLRTTPAAVMELFGKIALLDAPLDLASFQGQVGGNRNAVLNKLRELRLIGLIDSKPGIVALSTEARSAIERSDVPQFLRKSLRANGWVSDVLDQLSGHGELTVAGIADFLREGMPHVEASDVTWKDYAQFLAVWLNYSGLATLEGSVLKPQDSPPNSLPRERQFSRGSFKLGTFLPSCRPRQILLLLKELESGTKGWEELAVKLGKSLLPGIVRDAKSLNLVVDSSERIEAGPQARILFSRSAGYGEQDIAQIAISKENMRVVLEQSMKSPLSNQALIEILRPFGSATWTSTTWQWRLSILRSWLVATGQARSSRNGLQGI